MFAKLFIRRHTFFKIVKVWQGHEIHMEYKSYRTLNRPEMSDDIRNCNLSFWDLNTRICTGYGIKCCKMNLLISKDMLIWLPSVILFMLLWHYVSVLDLQEDNDNLIFKNEITTFEDVRDIVTRKHLLEIGFSCQYPKRGNVTLGFTIHRDNFTLIERGFGMFTYSFEFYPDNHFGTMVSPSLYPLDYEVGEKIYMQIQATSSVNNTVLFVESCRASPYDNPNYQPNYPIIENG